MLTTLRTLRVLALLLLIPSLAAAAPLGRSFTYQGKLSQSGAPVNAPVTLRFSLWDAAGTGDPPTGGNAVGASQIVMGVPVSDGLFSVEVNGGGEFGSSAFNGEARWLQVEVCTDGSCTSITILGPRQPMTAAPYALGPWQLSGTNISYTGGGVGIGTVNPQAALDVYGTVRWGGGATEFAYSGIDGSGLYLEQKGSTANKSRVRLQTSKSGDQINYTQFNFDPYNGFSFLGQGSGNSSVGIGTQSPSERLEVRGNIKLGSSGEYFAPAGPENLRILRGKISSTGTILFGTGFTATRSSTGVYSISYTTQFPAGQSPVITASAESSGTAKFAMINFPTYISAAIRIVNGSGTPVDSDFYFIAVGIR